MWGNSVGKLVLFLLIAWVAYLLLRTGRRGRDNEAKQPVGAEAMVRCAHCGLNVPVGESLTVSGRYYCSEEHRRLGAGTSSAG